MSDIKSMADVVREYGGPYPDFLGDVEFYPERGRSFGPTCRCGSRGTARVGESALMRQCQSCGQTYSYRLFDGKLVPFALETALAFDEERKNGHAWDWMVHQFRAE